MHKSELREPKIVFSKYLQNINGGKKSVKNAFPGVFNVNKLYFSVISNNLEDMCAKYEIMSFDFETQEDKVVVVKELPFPKAY